MTHERLKCSTVNINHGTDFPILCMCYKKKKRKKGKFKSPSALF